MKKIFNLFSFLLSITIIMISSSNVLAQANQTWASQQRIPGYNNDTFPPILIADQNHTVHAFFSQWLSTSMNRNIRAIMYNQWSLNNGWTKPIDILEPPLKYDARILDVYLDDRRDFHIIFWSGDNLDAKIYYSSAPLYSAQNARSWSNPILVADKAQDPENGKFYIDESGNYFVLFAGRSDTNGLMVAKSIDKGNTWSTESRIFTSHATNNIINNLSIYEGDSGSIFAIWNEMTSGGQGRGIYFGQIKSDNYSWSDPERLAEAETGYGTNTPAVIELNDTIYVLYNLGGKIMQRTKNEGADWSLPVQLFPRHVGVNGTLSLVIDENKLLHLYFGQRISGSPDIHGLWESVLHENRWTSPEAIVSGPRIMSGNNGSFDPYNADAVVSQGNVILVAWQTDPGNGVKNKNGVWYSYSELDVSPLVTKSAVNEIASSSTTESVTDVLQSLPSPTLETTQIYASSGALTEFNISPYRPITLMAAVVPSIIVVSGILIISTLVRRNRKQ